jgi:hypothetical protein
MQRFYTCYNIYLISLKKLFLSTFTNLNLYIEYDYISYIFALKNKLKKAFF